MKFSVVICTYSPDLYDHLQEAVESVRTQSYDDVEVVIVVDGNDELCTQVHDDYGDAEEVRIHCNEENVGLSESRNNGLTVATGDIIAFMDDDAVADEEWVEQLVATYEQRDAIAVGGQMTPIWVAGKPAFLPEEFYWLIGVTHRGFADPGEEVRNTNGSNMSYRADVLEELDGFDPAVGRQGERQLQAEEPELGSRMREQFGQGVVYNPDARVGHKVFEFRTDPVWLLKRAFWQGYSKRAMESILSGDASSEESDFLRFLLLESAPSRLRSLVTGPSVGKLLRLVMLFVFTGLVGLGYLYAALTWR